MQPSFFVNCIDAHCQQKAKLQFDRVISLNTVDTTIIVKTKPFYNQFAEEKRCVCETLMPPKHPSFEKHDPDI